MTEQKQGTIGARLGRGALIAFLSISLCMLVGAPSTAIPQDTEGMVRQGLNRIAAGLTKSEKRRRRERKKKKKERRDRHKTTKERKSADQSRRRKERDDKRAAERDDITDMAPIPILGAGQVPPPPPPTPTSTPYDPNAGAVAAALAFAKGKQAPAPTAEKSAKTLAGNSTDAKDGEGTFEHAESAAEERAEQKERFEEGVKVARQYAGRAIDQGEFDTGSSVSGTEELASAVKSRADADQTRYNTAKAAADAANAANKDAFDDAVGTIIGNLRDNGLGDDLTPAGMERLGTDADIETRTGLSPAQMQTQARIVDRDRLNAARNADLHADGIGPAQMQEIARSENRAESDLAAWKAAREAIPEREHALTIEADDPLMDIGSPITQISDNELRSRQQSYADSQLTDDDRRDLDRSVAAWSDLTGAAGLLATPYRLPEAIDPDDDATAAARFKYGQSEIEREDSWQAAKREGERANAVSRLDQSLRHGDSLAVDAAMQQIETLDSTPIPQTQYQNLWRQVNKKFEDRQQEYRGLAGVLSMVYDENVNAAAADDYSEGQILADSVASDPFNDFISPAHGIGNVRAEGGTQRADPVVIGKSKAQFIADTLGSEDEFFERGFEGGLGVPGLAGQTNLDTDAFSPFENPELAGYAARKSAGFASDVLIPFKQSIGDISDGDVDWGTAVDLGLDTASVFPPTLIYARTLRTARGGRTLAGAGRYANELVNPVAGWNDARKHIFAKNAEGVRAPAQKIDNIAAATGREITYLPELVVKGGVPESALTNVDKTARLQLTQFKNQQEAIEARNQLTQLARDYGTKDPVFISETGRAVELRTPPAVEHFDGYTAHATPTVGAFAEDITIRNPSEPDTGLFSSPLPPANYTHRSAFGKGAGAPGDRYGGGYAIQTGRGADVPSAEDWGKVFKSKEMGDVAEIESVTPDGTKLDGSRQTFPVRPAGADSFGRGVIVNAEEAGELSRLERVKLQARGVQGFVEGHRDAVKWGDANARDIHRLEQQITTLPVDDALRAKMQVQLEHAKTGSFTPAEYTDETLGAQKTIDDLDAADDARRRADQLVDPATYSPIASRSGRIAASDWDMGDYGVEHEISRFERADSGVYVPRTEVAVTARDDSGRFTATPAPETAPRTAQAQTEIETPRVRDPHDGESDGRNRNARDDIPETPETPVRVPETPETPETPVRDPETPETPVRDPETPETPVRDPETPETPVRVPETPETPVRVPETPETPVRVPETPETPVRVPETPETPVRVPETPETPVRVPETPETPVRVPETPETPVRVPETPETPVRVPETPETPVRVPETPETPVRVPETPETPVRVPETPETPVRVPETPETPVRVPETPETPVRVPPPPPPPPPPRVPPPPPRNPKRADDPDETLKEPDFNGGGRDLDLDAALGEYPERVAWEHAGVRTVLDLHTGNRRVEDVDTRNNIEAGDTLKVIDYSAHRPDHHLIDLDGDGDIDATAGPLGVSLVDDEPDLDLNVAVIPSSVDRGPQSEVWNLLGDVNNGDDVVGAFEVSLNGDALDQLPVVPPSVGRRRSSPSPRRAKVVSRKTASPARPAKRAPRYHPFLSRSEQRMNRK